MTQLEAGSAQLLDLLDEGVASGVFPRATAVVHVDGARVFEGASGGATARTVFDLASLTKVMAVTPAFLSLWEEGQVGPATPVARFLPDSAPARVGATVGDLLAHRAGLPAFEPFFGPVMRAHPELFEAACPGEVRAAARQEVIAQALATSPAVPPHSCAVYSDVGFIVLGELLARVAGAPLDIVFDARVASPLGLGAGFRRLSTGPVPDPEIAPTGTTRPREAAPGLEDRWPSLAPRPSVAGEVDDDNAWAMDGVAGHAGLFGTAAAVAAFGQAVLDETAGAGRIAPRRLWEPALGRDVATAGSTRALGFDTRLPGDTLDPASAGRRIGQRPPGAVGHLGFTGTSLWIDRARRVVVALCTNRTAGPRGRAETRIREFRARFHDAVVEGLGLE